MITYTDLDLDDDCGGHSGAGMSRYALCSDPATAPGVLAHLATEALSRTERDALYRNPALPFDDLFLALTCGKAAALHNPALPLYLVTCPTTMGETEDGNKITLTGAILRCLAHAISALCKAAPRSGVDVLRPWLFAALWGASRWYERDTLDMILGSGWDAHDQWYEVTVGLCDGMPAGDQLGGSAEALVCQLVGPGDVPFILALADNLAALGVSHDGERHLADVRAAAPCGPPGPARAVLDGGSVTALPVVRRRPEADCPFCGKAEGDACPACHGVNAAEGAAQKRRARVESERAGDGRNAPSPTVTETTATGKPAPRGDVCAGEES